MTYTEFKNKLEEIVKSYAAECNAAVSVKIEVTKEEIYYQGHLDDTIYDAEIQTTIK